MNVVTKYIAYLKDNPQGYWFKRKVFGWGWTPATWQGWSVMGVFVVFVIGMGIDMAANTVNGEPTAGQFYWFFARLLVALAVLIALCYRKGEKPRWMWGFPNDAYDKEN